MILRLNSLRWNKDFENDGILFFSQRIVEMLDFNTIDIYKAPLYNSSNLITEYISIYNGYAKDYHLVEVLHEITHTIKNDIVLINRFGQQKIDDVIDKLNSSNDKIDILKYLYRTIAPYYLQWSKDFIKKIVICNKEKRKIERAIRCFIPELLHLGYKKDDIYYRAREILFSDNPVLAFNTFIDFYDVNDKIYDVYFGLYKTLESFKDVLKKRMNIETVDGSGHLETWENYFEAHKANIKAKDAVSAADYVKKNIEMFTDYYQFFGNYSGNLVQKNAIVLSEDGQERTVRILCDKYNSIEQDDKLQIGDLAEKIVTCLLNDSRCSVAILNKATKLHNRAISNNGLQNGFLNLWSILEVICVVNEDNKINQIINKVVPILQKDFLVCTIQDICDNIKSLIDKNQYDTLFSKITQGHNDYEKTAMLLLLPEYEGLLNDFVDLLVNYPVLRSRMLNIHDEFSNKKRAYLNRSIQFKQRVTWHLYRMYRVRNAITHNGQKPLLLKDIGEHLHSYIDSILTNVIVKLSIMHLCEVSNVFVSDELELKKINDILSDNEPFDCETIQLIFHPERGTMNDI